MNYYSYHDSNGTHKRILLTEGTLPGIMKDLRETAKKKIKTEHDYLEHSGLPYMGKILDCDPVSVQRITVAVQAAQDALAAGREMNILWTCQDNSTVEFTAEQICGIPVALAIHSNQLHQTARQLKGAVDAATTPEELESITWPE